MVDDLGGGPAQGRFASPYDSWERVGADDPPSPGVTDRVAGALGALTSLALVAGLGFWTYDLAMRDLTAVPVVRALEGPARVAPDEPGGAVAGHQGLAVNTIQGDQEERPAPERVVLAPAAPALAEEDAAPEADLAERPGRSLGIGVMPGAQVMLASAEVAAPRTDAEAADPLRAALAEALALPEPEADAGPVPAGAPSVSPRPTSRPERVAAPEIPASALPAGTQLVQIGAFDSPEDARSRWSDLAARSPFLAGRAPVVQAASSGGRDFWRLRAAGFSDGGDASRVCAALAAEGVECVPVVVR